MDSPKSTKRFLPYGADFKKLDSFRRAETIILYIISALSFIIPYLLTIPQSDILIRVIDIIKIIDIILIIVYYILDVITEIFLYPDTARKRRKGLLDNSLGSKYLSQPVEGYYSNNEIEKGSKKILVNCYENCFFTYNIAKAMQKQIIIKNIVLFIMFIIVIYFGFRNNLFALPILEVLFSSLFLTGLIHHFNFLVKLKTLLERFQNEFSEQHEEFQTFQNAILFLLDYETTLAYNKSPSSNRVYKKLREKLSAEWELIKKRYDIK